MSATNIGWYQPELETNHFHWLGEQWGSWKELGGTTWIRISFVWFFLIDYVCYTLIYLPDFLKLLHLFSIELCPSVVHLIFLKFTSCFLYWIMFFFFAWICKFRSFAFHLIMLFLFSREFPNVNCVPLNYAVMFLAW